MLNDIRTVELFAGIGGFRLGLEMANKRINQGANLQNIESEQSRKQSYRVVWANEWDKYACQIYRKNFGEKEFFEGDVRKVNTNDIPDCDLIVGGFPCQPHSLAGKRKGFSDERGEVFYEIVRIARAKRPKMLLLENVKGLLSSEQGKAFGTVLEELGNIGYWCEWQVINSKHHGVPQNRERVFIIGHLRGTSSKQIFPISESDGVFEAESDRQQSEGAGIRGCISPTIDARYGALRNSGEPYILSHSPRTNNPKLGGSGPLISDEHCFTLDSTPHMVLLDNFGGNIQQRVKDDGAAWTLGGSKTGVIQEQSVRRLTEIECERLQGFPDNWTEGISGTQRYKCLGNAVTVNVIQFLGERLLASFDDLKRENTN